jgi:3-methyl-2-oxobutanoate hydroxymethyltransferase
MSVVKKNTKTRVPDILRMKRRSEKITVLTAYDYFTARILDQAGIDVILVGDTAANVVHGFETTLPMTMDLMVSHCAAVSRGNQKALIVGDMPFLTFQLSERDAILNAGRYLAEGGAEAVKLEGGLEMLPTIRRLVEIGIPVMGHIGLTPQSINRIGGPKVQGRGKRSRDYLMESALALEEAGCFSCVLELVRQDVSAEITSALKTMATIGIGAGPGCDGQVLVIHDILGLREPGFKPKFLREYADLPPIISDAAKRFIRDVKTGDYPSNDESFGTKED